MKSKTKRRVLWTLLVLVVVGLPAGYFGAREVLKRRIAGWGREGIAASEAGDHAKAAELLMRYLQRRPDDVAALEHYVKSRELAELPNGQHLAETIRALKVLIGQEADRIDDRRHLLDLYVRLDRRPEALDAANAILKDKKHQGDVRALAAKVEILTRLGQYREALDAVGQWLAVAPEDLKAHMNAVSLGVSLDYAADKVVEGAADLHKDDPKYEFLVGYAHARVALRPPGSQNDEREAARWLKAAAAHPGLTDDLVELIVAELDRLGLAAESTAVLQAAVKAGSAGSARHALARRYLERADWPRAAEVLADVDPASRSADPTLLAFKAIALANAGKNDAGAAAGAAACRAALSARNQAAARAWTILLRGMIDAAATDDKQLAAECRSALTLDPGNAYLEHYLGDATARLGDPEVAMQSWRRAARINPSWPVPSLRLVEALMQAGRPEEALMIAQDVARRSPTAGPVLALAEAYAASVTGLGAGDETNKVTDELLGAVAQLQEKAPGEEQTLALTVRLLARKGEKDKAIAAARAAINRTPPPSPRLLHNLASVSRSLGLGVEAECLARSEAAHGPTAGLALGVALDRLSAENGAAGLKAFDAVAAKAGKADDVTWRLNRARYLDFIGGADAKAAWVALGDAFPNNLAVQQAAASARAVRGDWDFLPRTIDRLKTLAGERSLAWRVVKARLMVESARNGTDYEQGSILLNEIIREYPRVAEPRVLLARALLKLRRTDAAIEQYGQAAALDPSSVPTALDLAVLLQARGDYPRVRQEVARVIPLLRTPEQRTRAAELLVRQGDQAEALKILDKVDLAGGGAAPESLLAAAIYRRTGKLDKAQAIIEKLMAKPDLATVQFAVSFYLGQGNRSEADAALAKLDALKLDPGIREMTLGDYQLRTGDPAKGVAQFREATRLARDNPAAWRTLAAGEVVAGNAAGAAAAIEEGARAVPSDAGLAALKNEAKLIGEAAADPGLRTLVMDVLGDPVNAEAPLELLRTLSEGRRATDAERLASRLQQLTERRPDYLPARAEFVEAYRAMGRSADALAAAKRTATAFPNSPQAARLVVDLCPNLTPPRWDEMLTAALEWKKRASTADPLPADVAIAGAYVQLKNYDAALAQLAPHAAAAKSAPDANPQLVIVYCIAAANAGRAAEAADLLWPLATKAAIWRTRWVEAAVSIRDPAVAAAWLDRVEPVVPPESLEERAYLAARYDELGRRDNNDKAKQAAAQLMGKLAADPKAPPMALLAAATRAEAAADVAAAEPLYDRAVSLNPNLWPALNNLAMVLVNRGGDLKRALALANKAADLQPRQPQIRDTVAQVQAKMGDPKAAAASVQLAVKLEPDNPKWRVRLAKYFLDAGDSGEALKALKAIDERNLDVKALPTELQDQLQSMKARFKGKP